MTDESRPPGRPVPDRARTPLLTLIVQQSLDEDYVDAAERRLAGGPRPPRGRSQRTAAVVVAVFGVLVSTAFVQTSRNADTDDQSRTSLVDRVENSRDRVARRQEREAAIAADNQSLERRLSDLTEAQQDAESAAQRLQVGTGLGVVHGEGVLMTIEEQPDADPNTTIRDSDLAKVANGFWVAGAEAISLNGQRLTARTAIRVSGAIEVNGVGVSSPYEFSVIGDRRTLQGRFFETTSGLEFAGLANVYGFTYELDSEDDLTLPAAPARLATFTGAIMVPDQVGPETDEDQGRGRDSDDERGDGQ